MRALLLVWGAASMACALSVYLLLDGLPIGAVGILVSTIAAVVVSVKVMQARSG